ncbi:hypothetical protein [uncultured Merdimonas sp.]
MSPLSRSCRNNWHGAKKDSWFSHIAVEVPGEEIRERVVRTGG